MCVDMSQSKSYIQDTLNKSECFIQSHLALLCLTLTVYAGYVERRHIHTYTCVCGMINRDGIRYQY